MPLSRGSKRTFEEAANFEESDDEDYDDKAPRESKIRRTKSGHRGKPAKKKRRGHDDDDSDLVDSEDDESAEDSFAESDQEEEPVETNEHGRPVRKAAKAAVTYEEPSSEEEIPSSSHSEGERKPAPKGKRKRLIVKLKTGATPGPATRSLRKRSGSFGGKHPPPSSDTRPRGIRHSSRIAGDDDEPVVALTNSGNHVEVIRAGSRDPEGIPARALKGGKGLKYPSKSTIDEEQSSGHTKDEPLQELEIKASQHEILESDPQTQGEAEDPIPRLVSGLQAAAEESGDELGTAQRDDGGVPDSGEEDEHDEDDEPIRRGRTRGSTKRKTASPLEKPEPASSRTTHRSLRSSNSKQPGRTSRRRGADESSDFAPEDEQDAEEHLSMSSDSDASPRKTSQGNDEYESSNGRRSRLRKPKPRSRQSPDSEEEAIELQEDLADLKADRPQRRRRSEIVYEERDKRSRGPRAAALNKDYRLLRPELNPPMEDLEEEPSHTPSRRPRGGGGGGGWQRSLLSTYGPFGGAGGLPPVLGGPEGFGAAGGVDSDSSDEENMQRPKPIGGMVGMTPTSALAPAGFGLFNPAQTINADPAQATTGTPANNLGKIKDKQALADADPLGVDPNVNFDSVGGLEGHIDQLKEMVALPLLYPEIFMRFHVTPPRGVLFHGPPGTGKTLLARALASSVSSSGRKVTFYMRKGADALSKWVGEAERQLRLLFEEARKNQPSIIFFDEIDGLAPVRSSKQEQIHASIVSTLLALMDGMDGRGQVIVIGATNRPDSIDPALRRPGRFDREFYFPLPNTEARRKILDIHTRGWDPPLDPAIKDELAGLTKGYGGADLRALCTEAALNAVQRRYPQIYSSNEKLMIDPKTITVTPKDFMISIKKMVPSSERSASSGASPLPPTIEPLLRRPLGELQNLIAEVLPQKKRITALEEAQYEDVADGSGFRKEKMLQAFETTRVFRPRLLVLGIPGMGQQYLAAALLNHFEGLHVQSFDLPTLLSDSASSPEATLVRLFAEVKMHKPSIIYIPNVQLWYNTVGQATISTFVGLLRSLSPTDPILLLGILEGDKDETDPEMLRRLFGYSQKNQFMLQPPEKVVRHEYFTPLFEYLRTAPTEFPDPSNRKKRIPEALKPVPPEPEKPVVLSKEDIKAQKRRDRQTLNMLKLRLQPIMDQIRTKYKKFRTGVIDESQIRYLYDETNPEIVGSDLQRDMFVQSTFRPFEIGKDAHGEPGLIETATGKFFYNLDSVTIEKRLSNGYYKRPKDFMADVKRLAKDARTIGDQERLLKANELLTNVEVDVGTIEYGEPAFTAECERVYQRELEREKEALDKAKKAAEEEGNTAPPRIVSNVPHGGASGPSTITPSTGPIVLGEPMPNGRPLFPLNLPVTPSRPSTSAAATNGYEVHHAGADSNITNGTSSHIDGNDADVEGDTHMGNTESHPNSTQPSDPHKANNTSSSSYGATQSAQPRPPHSYTAPSQRLLKESGMSAPLSQTGAVTPMAPGSQAAEYENEASTTQTTSGKKQSAQSSHERNTQDLGPNLYAYDEQLPSANGSQIPDTQGTQEIPSSQGSTAGRNSNPPPVTSHLTSSHSQHPPVPSWGEPRGQPQVHQAVRRTSASASASGSIQALLNHENADSVVAREPQPALIIDHKFIDNLHAEISDRTSGFSVEQLEQVNSALMDVMWKTRGEWNRKEVAKQVSKAFNAVVADMKEVQQDFLPSSWGNTATAAH